MKYTHTVSAIMTGLAIALTGPAALADNSETPTESVPGTTFELMGLGEENAPVVLMEYGSSTCGHCALFAQNVMPTIMPRIEAGEVRYEFREFLTAPGTIAIAEFQIIRCAGADKYFEGLDDVFENQDDIKAAARSGNAKAKLVALAERQGLSEAEFSTCVNDEALFERILEIEQSGKDLGVKTTPTLFLNGDMLMTPESHTSAGLNALIDAALAAHSEQQPDSPAAEASE